MAFNQSIVKLLIKLKKEYNLKGKLLTLGVQDVVGSHEEMMKVFEDCGIPMKPIPTKRRKFTRSVRAEQSNYLFNSKWMHQNDLFKNMFGFSSIESMDAYDNENPDILHNLNNPVPKCLHNKYDVILDIGTTEHIFNIKQVIQNITKMLKEGGVIIHITPLAEWDENKNFYYIQPVFYWDVYSANGFKDMKTFLTWVPNYKFVQSNIKCFYKEYKYNDCVSFRKRFCYTNVIFLARKIKEMSSFVTPMQNYYQNIHAKHRPKSSDVIPEVPELVMSMFKKYPLTKSIISWIWLKLPVPLCILLFKIFHRPTNRKLFKL